MEALTVTKNAQAQLAIQREKITADLRAFEQRNADILGQHLIYQRLLAAVERAEKAIRPIVSDLGFEDSEMRRIVKQD